MALDPNYGLINGIFRAAGLPRQPFPRSPDQAPWSIIGMEQEVHLRERIFASSNLATVAPALLILPFQRY